jgi:hypothetical protein
VLNIDGQRVSRAKRYSLAASVSREVRRKVGSCRKQNGPIEPPEAGLLLNPSEESCLPSVMSRQARIP